MINLTKNNKKGQNLKKFVSNNKFNPNYRDSEFESLDEELGVLELKHRYYGMDAYISEYYKIDIPFGSDNIRPLKKTINIMYLEALIGNFNDVSKTFKNINSYILYTNVQDGTLNENYDLYYEKMDKHRLTMIDFIKGNINNILHDIDKGDNNDEKTIAEYLKRK